MRCRTHQLPVKDRRGIARELPTLKILCDKYRLPYKNQQKRAIETKRVDLLSSAEYLMDGPPPGLFLVTGSPAGFPSINPTTAIFIPLNIYCSELILLL
jgi:hypothetical protein